MGAGRDHIMVGTRWRWRVRAEGDGWLSGLRRPERGSQEPLLCEGEDVGARHDQVIEESYLDGGQRLGKPLRDELVGCTLFPDPRGMVVIRQSPGGLFVQDQLNHLAWVDPCSVDRPAEELDAVDDAMPVIDQDEAEALVVEVAEPHR